MYDAALLERHEPRQSFPFLVGVYMATNAIPDAYLVVDSPDCAFFKAEHVHGTHDLRSTLLDAGGRHRIINTRADIGNIVDDRRTLVTEIFERVYRDAGTGLVAVSSMPMATVTGVEYGLLVRETKRKVGGTKPAIEIPGASLHQDWIHGYAAMLEALAEELDLPETEARDDTIAIVGYLMDRTEADHTANVSELRRLLEALGLRISSLWLDGSPAADLTRVADAGTIVSLPYGREAARILAERTGAKLLELELPFGLEATERFLNAVAASTGREDELEALRSSELSRIARALEFVVPHQLVGRRLVFCGEPYHAQAIVRIAREVGADVLTSLITASEAHLDADAIAGGRGRVFFEPGVNRTLGTIEEEFDGPDAADLLITNGRLIDHIGEADVPFLEHGFPSYFTHRVFDAPYLGYRGYLAFVGQIANRLALCEAMRIGHRRRGRPAQKSAAERAVQGGSERTP